MISTKLILPVVLTAATLLTGGVSAATNAEDSNVNTCPEISVQYEEKLSEKLEAGELTHEQYNEIIAAIESRDFRGAWGKGAMRGNASKLTEEQKAELLTKRDEMLAEKLESGEITQEQYDEIVAAIGSGEFDGHGRNLGKLGELAEEHKAELAEKWSENAQSGKFGVMFGNRINGSEELTDEQKAEIAEKQAEIAENGGFGAFRGGMRGNFGARGK